MNSHDLLLGTLLSGHPLILTACSLVLPAGRRHCQEAGVCARGAPALRDAAGRRLQPIRPPDRWLQVTAGEGVGGVGLECCFAHKM